VERPHLSLGEVIDHPITRLVIGCLKALIAVIMMLAAFIGTTYVGDIKGTIEKLATQLGDMDARVDALEQESAIRSALYKADRDEYRKALDAHLKRQAAKDAGTEP
jgi:outer membrane murein-binding lipoprotein Lpp